MSLLFLTTAIDLSPHGNFKREKKKTQSLVHVAAGGGRITSLRTNRRLMWTGEWEIDCDWGHRLGGQVSRWVIAFPTLFLQKNKISRFPFLFVMQGCRGSPSPVPKWCGVAIRLWTGEGRCRAHSLLAQLQTRANLNS